MPLMPCCMFTCHGHSFSTAWSLSKMFVYSCCSATCHQGTPGIVRIIMVDAVRKAGTSCYTMMMQRVEGRCDLRMWGRRSLSRMDLSGWLSLQPYGLNPKTTFHRVKPGTATTNRRSPRNPNLRRNPRKCKLVRRGGGHNAQENLQVLRPPKPPPASRLNLQPESPKPYT